MAKKQAEGFDNDFSKLMGVTFGASKNTSRKPKNIKGGKISKKTKTIPEKKSEKAKELSEKKNISKTTSSESSKINSAKKEAIVANSIENIKENIILDDNQIENETISLEPKIKKIENISIDSDSQNKETIFRDFKIDEFFTEYEGEYYTHVYTRITDRDFIRIIARFESININSLTDNIIQAWLNKHNKYFEDAGYLGFLELKPEFKTDENIKDNPFNSKSYAKERNTTTRVSFNSAESMRHITTIENVAIFKIIASSIYWWKKQYAPVLRKKKYFNFIKNYMKDVD